MNKQMYAAVQGIYEEQGLPGLRTLIKEIQATSKRFDTLAKEGRALEKEHIDGWKREEAQKASTKKSFKPVLKALKADPKFKAAKKLLDQAAKDAVKATKAAKKVVAAELKAQKAAAKPTKDSTKQAKRWAKVLSKVVKVGDTETQKALKQLQRLVKLQKAAAAKAEKAAAKAEKTAAKAAAKAEKAAAKPQKESKKEKVVPAAAVGDDLIATLLAKAEASSSPQPVDKSKVELVAEMFEEEDDEEEEEIRVVKFEHDGVKYLRDGDDYLYDPETEEEIAFWNEDDQCVEDLEVE